MLAHTKIAFYNRIINSNLVDDPLMEKYLYEYFPSQMVKRFQDLIELHPLRREIIAVSLVNSMANRVGSGFVNDLQDITGCTDEQVAIGFSVTCELFDLQTIWQGIEDLDYKIPTSIQHELMIESSKLVEFGSLWILRRHKQNIKPSPMVDRYKHGILELINCINQILNENSKEFLNNRIKKYTSRGVPTQLAEHVARIYFLFLALDIIDIFKNSNKSLIYVARLYFKIGGYFEFSWLRISARNLAENGNLWTRKALSALISDFYLCQKKLTEQILDLDSDESVDKLLDDWNTKNPLITNQIKNLLKDIHSEEGIDLSMLMTISYHLRLFSTI